MKKTHSQINFSSLPLKYLYWQCEKSVKGVANRTKSADIIIFINIYGHVFFWLSHFFSSKREKSA